MPDKSDKTPPHTEGKPSSGSAPVYTATIELPVKGSITESNYTQRSKWNIFHMSIGALAFDIAVCALIATFLINGLPRLIKPHQRGFFCGDDSIRYPYRPETVTSKQNLVIAYVILILTVISTEVFRALTLSKQKVPYRRCALAVKILTYIAYGLISLLINFVLTQTTKFTAGRLRPHFLDVCKPNVTLSPCDDPHEFITNFVCQGESQHVISRARKSFFSGHTAKICDVVIFCVIYMQASLPRRMYGLVVRPLLQLSLISIALFISLSRINDYMHHWSDVVIGVLVGFSTGYYAAVILGRVYERADGDETRRSDPHMKGIHVVPSY